MNFMTDLPNFTIENKDNYDLILVIIDELRKIIYNQLVKTTIDAFIIAKITKNVVIRHLGLLALIVINKSFFIISKFWL